MPAPARLLGLPAATREVAATARLPHLARSGESHGVGKIGAVAAAIGWGNQSTRPVTTRHGSQPVGGGPSAVRLGVSASRRGGPATNACGVSRVRGRQRQATGFSSATAGKPCCLGPVGATRPHVPCFTSPESDTFTPARKGFVPPRARRLHATGVANYLALPVSREPVACGQMYSSPGAPPNPGPLWQSERTG